MINKRKMTMGGGIVGNRRLFIDYLAKSGREELLQVLQKANMDALSLGLLLYICENGFEHHVSANFSEVGPIVHAHTA
jgi:L-fucose isomerase-like protein